VGMRPRLVCIPSTDAAFGDHANALLGRMLSEPVRPTDSQAFGNRLRLRYPTAVVRERHQLADRWPGDGPVWYVIRRAFGSRISASIDIAAERDQVFQVYVERMPEWQVAVRLRPLNRRSRHVGAEYSAEYEFMGRSLHGRMRIVDASPPRALRVEAEGMGVNVWYVTTFTPVADGTRVEVAGDYVMPNRLIPAALERLVAERRIARDIERAHAALRDLCQGLQPDIANDAVTPVDLVSPPQ
jgi:hypothetical protein